jgi:hypothetical protein
MHDDCLRQSVWQNDTIILIGVDIFYEYGDNTHAACRDAAMQLSIMEWERGE